MDRQADDDEPQMSWQEYWSSPAGRMELMEEEYQEEDDLFQREEEDFDRMHEEAQLFMLTSFQVYWQAKEACDDLVFNLKRQLDEDIPREKKKRQKQGVVYYTDITTGDVNVLRPTESQWYLLYCQGEETGLKYMRNFHSKFRLRFRMPHSSYIDLVNMCVEESMKDDGLFKRWRPGSTTLDGRDAAPMKLLVLCALRYLGRGWTFDDLQEATAISEEVIRVFFHQFIAFGSTVLFKKFVVAPTTIAEGEDNSNEYAEAGFPGCIGSMDASHIEHQRVSYKSRQSHLSYKLPFTSRTYNITVNHRRRILSTTDGHPARWNDKSLVKVDRLANILHNGEGELAQLPFELYEYDDMGQIKTVQYKGAWLLVDNGYLNWGVTIPPIKDTDTEAEAKFSKWLEGMRKDVECTFGILKGRFRVLKSGIRTHGTDSADMTFKTCCALHNYLLEVDGLDTNWQSVWTGDVGMLDEEDIPVAIRALNSNNARAFDRSRVGRLTPAVAEQPPDDAIDDTQDDDDDVQPNVIEYDDEGAIKVHKLSMEYFRAKLIQHFDIKYRVYRNIHWPKKRLNNMEEPT